MNANERFEYMAEQFYKKTGMLAPGKDCSSSFARSEKDIAERDVEWRVFIEEFSSNLFQTHADMYEMLERIMGNYQVLASIAGQNEIVFDEYAQDSKDTESLLKRARGE